MKWLKSKKDIPVLSPLEGYNRWASTYSDENNPIKNFSDSLVEKFLPDLTGKTFLDVGCGTGKFCSKAEELHASRVVGIDLSPGMIEIAKLRCPQAEFRCGDLVSLTLEEEQYDVIICALVLGHIKEMELALTKLLKGLTKNGVIIITDFHPFLTLLKSRRTFKDKITGNTFEIQHHLHLFQDYVHCLSSHGVVITTLEEPSFNNSPVVFGLCAQKVNG